VKFLPVVADGRPVGHIGLREVKALSPTDRLQRRVRDGMTPLSPDSSIAPGADAAAALAQMQRTGLSRLLVVEGGRLAGVICLKDLLDQLSLRSELNLTPEPA
jgi:CBS domain-containing protein